MDSERERLEGQLRAVMRGEERKPAVVLERLVEENGALRARLAVAEGVIARAVGVAEKAGGLGVLVEADGLTEVGAILSEYEDFVGAG